MKTQLDFCIPQNVLSHQAVCIPENFLSENVLRGESHLEHTRNYIVNVTFDYITLNYSSILHYIKCPAPQPTHQATRLLEGSAVYEVCDTVFVNNRNRKMAVALTCCTRSHQMMFSSLSMTYLMVSKIY